MQYLLMIYGDERHWQSRGEAETAERIAEYVALMEDLTAQGKLLGANQLQATETATTVRVRDGEVVTTDGPYSETKEVLGGYFLIEANSLDDALEVAARIPNARDGMVEVRPVVMREAGVTR